MIQRDNFVIAYRPERALPKPATIKQGWAIQDPGPESCAHGIPWVPVAVFDTDGVCLYYEACWGHNRDDWVECEWGCQYWETDIEWPFIEDAANKEDFERAGFRTEIA